MAILETFEFRVNVEVRRLGGGFGAKLTRNSAVAAACALAAYKLGKPVRVSLDMSGNMDMIGKRTEYFTDYKVLMISFREKFWRISYYLIFQIIGPS